MPYGMGTWVGITSGFITTINATAPLQWDAGTDTLSINLPTEANIILAKVWNDTGVALQKGAAVYISGALNDFPTVALADASDPAKTKVLGLVHATIADGTEGMVLIEGPLTGVNTDAYLIGTALYLDATTPGALTATAPVAPDQKVLIGYVTKKDISDGFIETRVQIGLDLKDLTDVSAAAPEINQSIVYDPVTSLWVTDYADAKRLIVKAKNDTGGPLTTGQVVYIDSSDGSNPLIKLASASSLVTTGAKTIGLVNAPIPTNAIGYVITDGLLINVDTNLYAPGTILYLSDATPGAFTNTPPVAPNHEVRLGVVIVQGVGNGRIEVKVEHGKDLGELCDVSIATPTAGQVLQYDSVNKIWENQTLVSADISDLASNTVSSLAKFGDTPLVGSVTISAGSNVTLTQVGQDIEIAASGGGGGGSAPDFLLQNFGII